MEKSNFTQEFNIGGFSIFSGNFDVSKMAEIIIYRKSLSINKGHRQFYPYDRFPETFFYTTNAHNCLAGVSFMKNGVYLFHDPPNSIQNYPLNIPRSTATEKTIIGGGLDYWMAAKHLYREQLKDNKISYIPKPQNHETDVDYSFAYALDILHRELYYGYYFFHQGPSGDAWIWE